MSVSHVLVRGGARDGSRSRGTGPAPIAQAIGSLGVRSQPKLPMVPLTDPLLARVHGGTTSPTHSQGMHTVIPPTNSLLRRVGMYIRVGPVLTDRRGITTLPISDDYYIKSICPSGGHGRGHRLALQKRAAARNVPLTVKHRGHRSAVTRADSSVCKYAGGRDRSSLEGEREKRPKNERISSS